MQRNMGIPQSVRRKGELVRTNLSNARCSRFGARASLTSSHMAGTSVVGIKAGDLLFELLYQVRKLSM